MEPYKEILGEAYTPTKEESSLKVGNLSIDSPIEEIDKAQEAVYEALSDFFWKKVFYLSTFASTSVSTSSSSENMTGREPDTTAGLYLSPNRPSKFRLMFYLLYGAIHATIYIASPGISTSTSLGSTIADSTKSFVGLKISQNGTLVELVSYNHNDGVEITRPTTATFSSSASTSHILEIYYNPGTATMYLDNELLGSIECKLHDDNSFEIFYPYITSIKSSGGTVNLTIDGYEFMQDRR